MGRIRSIKNAHELVKSLPLFSDKIKFNNNNKKCCLEIGSGKGDFIIDISSANNDTNYIALEKDATVMLKALRKANKIIPTPNNLIFINNDADNLKELFGVTKINKIYLNFSDPWPKRRNENNRLTCPKFLELYHQLLEKNGLIEFKTDNDSLYEYSLNIFNKSTLFTISYNTTDLYKDMNELANNIPTEYEKKFVNAGKNIYKIILIKH
ncbi:tRNA (guanine-N(7)-)-methyltransferase [Bacilli bacterium]|nr:tRNA (guanine-N(7)-)-methyltransferase [Bacilli bacterium]